MSRDPTARTLLLLSLLQSGGDWTGPRLAERMGITTRTVRRDAERLRELGYDVTSRPGPGSSYRLTASTRVPPLLLEPDEITAVVAGLRLVAARQPGDDASARALVKLTGLLPGTLRKRATATDLATEVLDGGDRGVDSAAVGIVADAVANDGRVRFGYRDQHGRASIRLVDPHRHVLDRGRAYLVGRDVDRDDWRLFRFDRMTEVVTVPGRFARHEFPDDSIGHWFATDFGRS